MTYENLIIDNQDGIYVVTINRPKALNALNGQIMSEIEYFFGTDAPQQTDLKGVILTGAGEKSFAAGADIKEFLNFKGNDGGDMSKKGHGIFFLIERFSKPVIALVNGYSLGAGCELAMACHLRIATPNALFGQPEINLGTVPGYGGTQRLIQYIGKGKAVELLLTADNIKADEALQLGLVNYVLEPEEAMSKCKKIISKSASKGPLAVAKTIECINAYFDVNTDGFAAEVSAFNDVTQTADFIEGATAFIEKRKPNFKGE
ncbi:MAG: enoyl-CoA hydratase [Saprospiraceae bacterium]|jgi:enoyl-CoA hydratase